MVSLLDQFSLSPVPIRAGVEEDVFGLMLASKLQDQAAARHYVQLSNQHPRERLLTAYRRTVKGSNPQSDLGRTFHRELERLNGNHNGMHEARLIALHIERRAVAAAILDGERLIYTQRLELSSNRERVVGSAVGFLSRLIQQFEPESAAVGRIPDDKFIQRATLSQALLVALREATLPVWEVDKHALLEAYGAPQLRSRRQLREVICAIWPSLAGANGKHFIQDAAALGLYVQTERLFLN
jgi:hypothetical protein